MQQLYIFLAIANVFIVDRVSVVSGGWYERQIPQHCIKYNETSRVFMPTQADLVADCRICDLVLPTFMSCSCLPDLARVLCCSCLVKTANLRVSLSVKQHDTSILTPFGYMLSM